MHGSQLELLFCVQYVRLADDSDMDSVVKLLTHHWHVFGDSLPYLVISLISERRKSSTNVEYNNKKVLERYLAKVNDYVVTSSLFF